MMEQERLKNYLKVISPIKIEEDVSTRLEVSNHLRKYDCAVLFNHIKEYPSWNIVGNICTSRRVFADMLTVPTNLLLDTLAEAMNRPTKYGKVSDAGFLKNEIEVKNIKKRIPLVMFYPEKERYYSSATIFLAIDPDTGQQNASFHRMMHLNGNRFSVRVVPRDLFNIYDKNKQKGRHTKVIAICGVHPAISLAAATSYQNMNELELANTFLKGELKCIDIDGIDVPVETEVVMMGQLLHDEVADEGPFVDITGTWDKVRREPVFEVEKVYIQNDPIWQVILPGWTEHRILMGLTQEPRILNIVRNTVPSVKDVVLTRGGVGWLHAVVSISKRHEGEGQNAGMATLSAHPSLKRVIVVDDDINVNNSESVEWALATRLKPDEGITFVKGARSSSLDPSSAGTGVSAKWIVDATIPLNRNRRDFEKVEGN
jgi:UbiD family decarboxylase|tara:strand:- start:6 stop:1292 length:1287 start_codon:yes stop_codon:yes gene_type:complete